MTKYRECLQEAVCEMEELLGIRKDLKPCPFCGCPPQIRMVAKENNPEWNPNGTYYEIICSNETCAIRPNIISLDQSIICNWQHRRRKNNLAYD